MASRGFLLAIACGFLVINLICDFIQTMTPMMGGGVSVGTSVELEDTGVLPDGLVVDMLTPYSMWTDWQLGASVRPSVCLSQLALYVSLSIFQRSKISQGSVPKRLRCGGVNLLHIFCRVKEILKVDQHFIKLAKLVT